MFAETKLGGGDRAYECYCQINPAGKDDIIDEFECEPYVYPQNILGDEHPLFGLTRNSWLTGTASWTYQAGLKYILGICPEYDSLLVDPCLPSGWKGFSVTRKFRGAVYQIQVSNPEGICKGIRSIKVDGELIKGTVLPIFKGGKVHKVNVVLGKIS
jgi:cellobiose phosphorylase